MRTSLVLLIAVAVLMVVTVGFGSSGSSTFSAPAGVEAGVEQ